MLVLLFDILNIPILVAQIAGAETALLATFFGNNFWAFKGKHYHAFWNKIARFHASALGGLLINSTLVVVLVKYGHLYYGAALVIGSVCGLVWNYTAYKKFVFKYKND